MKISKSRFMIYMGLLLIACFALIFSLPYINNNYHISFILISLLFLLITGFFILKKNIVLFDPMVIFSAYYYTVVISGIYLIFTNFETSIFFLNTSMSHHPLKLFNYSLFYFIVGYLSALIGYLCFIRKNKEIKITFENKSKIPDSILNLFIAAFLIIGIINFAYMIFVFAGGDIFTYMQNIALRKYEIIEKGGTTLGYWFAFVAMYLWFFKLLRKRSISLLFLLFLVITAMMKASEGRILQTIVYISSFVVIYYYYDVTKNEKVHNIKYYIGFLFFGILGVGIYFLRILSSLSANNKLGGYSMDILFTAFLRNISFFAIDKGNIPHIPILMQIIDKWEADIGFLYGQSLLKPFLAILPTSIRPEVVGYSLGLTIKETWYTGIQSGGLPPTAVGDWYANFGALGPFIGMFMFGAFCAWLYNLLLKTGSYWVLVIYSQILIGFILIYAKGELMNFSLWYVLPVVFTVTLIKCLIYVSSDYKKICH